MLGPRVWIAVFALVAGAAAGESIDREVARLRGLAARYVARERPGDATRNLLEALSLRPRSTEVLHDLLRLARPDEFALWAHYLGARATNDKGFFRRPKHFATDVARGVEPAVKLAQVRATAVERLASQAKRLRRSAAAATARYLRGVGQACMTGVPALHVKYAPIFDKAVERCEPDGGAVLAKLDRGMLKAIGEGREADAMRAAVILRGACVQARRVKLEVRRLQAMETNAVMVLRRIRKAQRGALEPLTVEGLRSIEPKDRPRWEAEHADWTNPTVVWSPNKRYRIESICGVRTTLVAAGDIEYQHRRLAAWYGRDPFEKVQGTVRLVPSPAGLEGEGQPHYWAGGFQSGHVTTLAVSASNRNGLASGLTHELTHRFDGAVYPGMPAWLAEGRAVYTAGATLWPRAQRIEPRAISFGAIHRTMIRGYRSQKKLQELIEGTIEDYRDNYQAGYTLWLYLTRFRKEWYGDRVQAYLKSFRARPGWPAMQRFGHYLLDGKQGRPKEFATFARDFSSYVGEGGAIDAVEWKKDWNRQARAARKEASDVQQALHRKAKGKELESPYDREILDHSNWSHIRSRSDDPAFGERHAYAAGLWLEQHGAATDARDAFEWARSADELRAEQLLHIAAFHAKRGKPGQAWLLRLAARTRSLDELDLGRTPAPAAALHQDLLPLLRGLRELETAYRKRGLVRAARAMLAERVRLARRAGRKLDPFTDDAKVPGRDRLPPDCGPYLSLLATGLVEEYWAPAESAQNGLFHIGAPDLLVMGRKKPRKETTGFARDAGVRRTFVRAGEWFTGTYTLRVRVKFISAHLNGAIVFGHSRGDRGTILSISGGDWAYAVGRKKEGFGFPNIHVALNDLRAYDGGVGRMGRTVHFRTPKTSVLLTVRVSGSFVRVFLDGKETLSHRTTTSLPIEGRIGFYLGSGLVAFERPEVRRHRAIGPRASCPCEHADTPLDLSTPCTIKWESFTGRRVAGLPRDPLGTLLLCYTSGSDAWNDEAAADGAVGIWSRILGGPERLKAAHRGGAKRAQDLPWAEGALIEHAGLPDLRRAREAWIENEAKTRAGVRNVSIEYARKELAREAESRTAWLAIDPRGVVRSCGLWIDGWWGGHQKNLIRRLRGW